MPPEIAFGLTRDYGVASVDGRWLAVARRGTALHLDVYRAAAEANPNAFLAAVYGPARFLPEGGEPVELDVRLHGLGRFEALEGRRFRASVALGPLPDAVGTGRLEIPLRVVEEGTGRLVREGVFYDLALTEARPVFPFSPVVARAARDAARLASGARGEADVSSRLVRAIHAGGRFVYDDSGEQFFRFDLGCGSLGRMLDAPSPVPANCYQISAYAGALLGALGVDGEWREVTRDPPAIEWDPLFTRPVLRLAAGEPCVEPLGAHAYLWVDGLVYDPTYGFADGAIVGVPEATYLGLDGEGLLPLSDGRPLLITPSDLPVLE